MPKASKLKSSFALIYLPLYVVAFPEIIIPTELLEILLVLVVSPGEAKCELNSFPLFKLVREGDLEIVLSQPHEQRRIHKPPEV